MTARCRWKSTSSVTHTRSASRALRSISISLAFCSPISLYVRRPNHTHVKWARSLAQAPGRAGCASGGVRSRDVNKFVVEVSGRVLQRLLQVLGFEEWILCEQGCLIGKGRKQLEHTPNGDPHATDARLASAFLRLYRYAIEPIGCHNFILRRTETLRSLCVVAEPFAGWFARWIGDILVLSCEN
jgi:hypothetical protein